MNAPHIFIVFIIMSTSIAFSQVSENGVCEDLNRLSCSPGVINDGTGTAVNASALDDRSSEIEKRALQRAKQRFSDALRKNENGYLRKVALSATGLSQHPSCKISESGKFNSDCLDMLSSGVAAIFARQQRKSSAASAFNQIAEGPVSDLAFLTDSSFFKEVQIQVIADLKIEMKEKQLEDKIGKVFPKVRSLLVSKIDSLVDNPKLRENLKEKMKSVQFAGTDCSKEAGEGEKIPSVFLSNAFYDVVKNTFKYCLGTTLQNDSEFQIAFIIAHELAHGVSPCGITRGPSDYTFRYSEPRDQKKSEQEFPVGSVLTCLRGEKSIRAESKPSSGDDNQSTDTIFCENDQIDESYADWMAAEILPDYIERNHSALSTEQKVLGFSNVFRGDCEIKDALETFSSLSKKKFDVHPETSDRVNRILLAQPKVRTQMGCDAKMKDRVYCAGKSDHSNATNSTNSKGVN